MLWEKEMAIYKSYTSADSEHISLEGSDKQRKRQWLLLLSTCSCLLTAETITWKMCCRILKNLKWRKLEENKTETPKNSKLCKSANEHHIFCVKTSVKLSVSHTSTLICKTFLKFAVCVCVQTDKMAKRRLFSSLGKRRANVNSSRGFVPAIVFSKFTSNSISTPWQSPTAVTRQTPPISTVFVRHHLINSSNSNSFCLYVKLPSWSNSSIDVGRWVSREKQTLLDLFSITASSMAIMNTLPVCLSVCLPNASLARCKLRKSFSFFAVDKLSLSNRQIVLF